VLWGGAEPTAVGGDAVAIAAARRLADACGGELVGVTIGLKKVDWGMARGLDRAIALTGAPPGLADTDTASLLAAGVRAIAAVDLVAMGDAAVDSGAPVVAALLAGELGLPCIQGVDRLEAGPSGPGVERRVRGGVEVLSLIGPAVVAVTSDCAKPTAPGMRDILAARKKPVDTIEAPPGRAPLRVLSSGPADAGSREGIVIDGSDPAAAAAALVDILIQAAVI
jgi:electron transfer flavoprotein beta subunit